MFIKNKGYPLCIQPYATVFVYDGVCQITDLIYHVSPHETHNPDENVTVCCTVENQQNADKKLSVFRTLPIKHKCITAQPLIERVNLEPYLDGVELVVVGGESDKDARPLDYNWVLDIREQCIRKRVNFEFRQCGTHFIKDGRQYKLQTKDLCRQARLAGINYKYTNELL